MSASSLLAGPPPETGMETIAAHRARLGPLPAGGEALIETLERSGLRGRGGAAFPVAAKWQSVAGRRGVLVVNGAEGEPLSGKDRVLMEMRPHLILDGAALAAASVGARRVVLYLGAGHQRARQSMQAAVAERSAVERRLIEVAVAPERYVAGEETAAVQFLNRGVALPTATPPRPFERGVGGRPTLVQNVESLAQAALIARHGAQAHGHAGQGDAAGTALLTVSGAVALPGVIEMPLGSSLAEVVARAGGLAASSDAILLGGYFGGWVATPQAWSLPLDPVRLRGLGHSLGCGVVAVLPAERCGVVETARILAYLAAQSARQCGPCEFGLGAIARTAERLAGSLPSDVHDLARLQRWAQQLRGRGACRHPDGAAGFLLSALGVFQQEFHLHHEGRHCSAATRRVA